MERFVSWECVRLIGNTEVNGKHAYTSVFFIGVDGWVGAVTEVAVNLACTSVVAERVCWSAARKYRSSRQSCRYFGSGRESLMVGSMEIPK